MKFRYRVVLLASGGFVLVRGWTRYMDYGVFPYVNHKMQPVFPIGVVIVGAVIMALPFLPNQLKIDPDPKVPKVLRRFRKFR